MNISVFPWRPPLEQNIGEHIALSKNSNEGVKVMGLISLVKDFAFGDWYTSTFTNAWIKAMWASVYFRNIAWNDFTNFVTFPIGDTFIATLEGPIVVCP